MVRKATPCNSGEPLRTINGAVMALAHHFWCRLKQPVNAVRFSQA